MDVEAKQIEVLEQFCLLAKSARGRGLVELINQATSDSNLFAFGELLDVPQIKELHSSEHSASLSLLRLFAYGTWPDYKANKERLPPLQAAQEKKLKQLTVMTMAETNRVLPYDLLTRHLDIGNVRELEDFLINDCMYAGIVQGKLDQNKRSFEVRFAAGRDLRRGQLDAVIDSISKWLRTSEGLLSDIEEKIKWADNSEQTFQQQKKQQQEKVEECKKLVWEESELRSQPDVMFGEGPSGMDYVEEERVRPKRRK